jgi:TRAP-type C4-dicarboxylate transport system substrate-binding protein
MALSTLTVKEERARGLHDWYRKIMAKEINAYYLGQYHAPQWFRIGTNIPVKMPGDLANLKIRSISFLFPGFKAVGAVPVAMPMPDVYTAMERNVIDGFAYPYASNWVEIGMPKVTKYVVGPRIFYGQNSALIVNLDKWKSLPPHLQKVMQDSIVENEEVWYQWWIDTGNKEEKKWQDAGMKFIEWAPADSEWFNKTFTNALWDWVLKNIPDYGTQFKELVTK